MLRSAYHSRIEGSEEPGSTRGPHSLGDAVSRIAHRFENSFSNGERSTETHKFTLRVSGRALGSAPGCLRVVFARVGSAAPGVRPRAATRAGRIRWPVARGVDRPARFLTVRGQAPGLRLPASRVPRSDRTRARTRA